MTSPFKDPFDKDTPIGCGCGRHASQAEHNAAAKQDDIALRAETTGTAPGASLRAEDPFGDEAVIGRVVEQVVMRALFPVDATRRAFLSAIGATTAAAAVAGAFPLGAAKALGLTADDAKLLASCPYRGSIGQDVPTDALVYRFYEIIQVYGTTLKAVIEEKFGDGIMSAIDFSMDIKRVKDPKGDRVLVTMNGKFLPYRRY